MWSEPGSSVLHVNTNLTVLHEALLALPVPNTITLYWKLTQVTSMCHATMSGGMLQRTKKYKSLKHNSNTEKNLKGFAQKTSSNGHFEDCSKISVFWPDM